MANEASFSVTGYVATQPKLTYTKNGDKSVYMRVGWTPRWLDRKTGQWTDQQTSFISVVCYRKVAENAALCLRRGDPVLIKGTLQVREFGDDPGSRRQQVEVVAESIGHDLARGYTIFNRSADRSEQTAFERQQALVADGREPLPGDTAAAEAAAAAAADATVSTGEGAATSGAAGFLTDVADGDTSELGSTGELGSFDDDEARELLETDEVAAAG